MAELKDRQIKLVHELMYQIKVEQVMTSAVITFPPTATFREIQQCMKQKRFSGTPIVEGDEIVGMVSIDDILTAFDRGAIDTAVAETMTRDVLTIPGSHSVIAASNIFAKHRFGRLPVVDGPKSRKLIGILTFSDILSHLLLEVNKIAERVELQQLSLDEATRHAKGSLHFELAADDFDLAGMASTTVKKHLKQSGIEPGILRRISVICYEAEMNVIIHSMGGYMQVDISNDRVAIEVVDEGPGIPDPEAAMEPGFTTANEKIRALGFGAGMGLANMKRCADQFSIRSSMESGTVVQATVFLEPREHAARPVNSTAG